MTRNHVNPSASFLLAALLISPAIGASDRSPAENQTTLVSRASGFDAAKGNHHSTSPLVSADGRHIVFTSRASNIHPDATTNVPSIFVRDLATQEVTLVSRASGPDGESGNYESLSPSISADGRYVAFMSAATNIHPDKTECEGQQPLCMYDVFVRDLHNHDTILVSRASGADGPKGNFPSWRPRLSADGRRVVFFTASSLHPDSPSIREQVYLRDLESHETLLVSRASGVDGPAGDFESFQPSLSGDGRYVVFASHATNLHEDDQDSIEDVYVRDLQMHETVLVSRASGSDGVKGNSISLVSSSAISADGRYVAFFSTSSNLHPDDTDNIVDVFVRDLHSDNTYLISRALGADGAKGDGSSYTPAISADGRYVAFGSQAGNLHPDKNDDVRDILVRDLHNHDTTLVSRASGADGVKSNGTSDHPSISADGRYVTFESLATNLHPDADDNLFDVYLRELAGHTGGGAELAFIPAELDFGEVPVGTVSHQTVILQNTGSTVEPKLYFTMNGNNFQIAASSCHFATLAPGESCELLLDYAPAHAAIDTAVLIVTSAPGTSAELPLAGTGAEPGTPDDPIFEDRFQPALTVRAPVGGP